MKETFTQEELRKIFIALVKVYGSEEALKLLEKM